MTAPGSKGQPEFGTGDTTTVAAYLSSISDYAALVGNRKTGTEAQMNACTEAAGTAWDGLVFFATDGDGQQGAEFLRLAGVWQTYRVDQDWSLLPIQLQTGFTTKTDPAGGTTEGSLVGGIRRIDRWIHLRFWCKWTGSTLTPNGGGNFNDVPLAVIGSNLAPTGEELGRFNANSVSGGLRVDQTGTVYITDIYPGATIPAGKTVKVSAHWPLY